MAILHIDAQNGNDLSLLKSEYYTNPGVLTPTKWAYSLGRNQFDAKFINENKNYYSNPIETTYEFGDILVYWHCYGDGYVACNVKARGSSTNLISFTHSNTGSRPVIEYYLDFAVDTTLKKGYFVVISLQHIPYEGNNWQEFIYLADGGETLYNLLVNTSESGGAGSGYIGNSLLSNKKMVGYNVPTSSAESTKTESVNDVSASAVSGKPKSGNGFAKIKFLREPEYDTWIDGKKIYVQELEYESQALNQDVVIAIPNLDIDTLISFSGTYNRIHTTYGHYWYKFATYENDTYRSFARILCENGNYTNLVYHINLDRNAGNSTSKQIFRIIHTKKTEV